MSEIVFILGAGASKHAGAPLMAEFLDTARDLYAAGVPGISRSAFDRVFRAIADLQIVHSKSELDLINLESVFGAFEMARLIGSDLGSAERSATGGDELVSAMQRVITETLQETVLFPVQGAQIHAPAQYDAFAQFIQSLRGVNKRVAFITFNYDVALDYALHFYGLNPDYGVLDTQGGGVLLLKIAWFAELGTVPSVSANRCCEIQCAFHGTAPTDLEMEIQSGSTDVLPTPSARTRDRAANVGQSRISRRPKTRVE